MVLLQGIVIGRALMDAMREKSAQNANSMANMYRSNRQRVLINRLKRRTVAPPFESVFDDDLRVARMGGNTARRQFQTASNYHRASTLEGPVNPKKIQFTDADFVNTKWTNIYRFTKIRQMALASQAKLGQTLFTAVAVPSIHYQYAMGAVGLKEVIFADSVMAFALSMLVAMSFYFRRFVGVIAISDDRQWIRIGHMNFWGRRINSYMPVEDLIPLTDVVDYDTLEKCILTNLRRYSVNHVFFMFVHSQWVKIEDAQQFRLVFGETPLTKLIPKEEKAGAENQGFVGDFSTEPKPKSD